jgi:hypothetical protein
MCKAYCANRVMLKMSAGSFPGQCGSMSLPHNRVTNVGLPVQHLQKKLDSRSNIDIIIFTYLNGRSATDETIITPPAGRPESSPGRCPARELSQQRLFRSGGPAAGQVRDAAAVGCRPATGQPGGQGVRFLTAIVLSGAGRLSTSGPRWLVAAETRSPIRPQAHGRAHAVCNATPRRRAGDFYSSTSPTSGTALRRLGSPPQHRSSTAAPKKTSVNPESISSCFTDRRLVAAYEELRCQAVQGGRGPGLAVMISRGFRCWMEAWSQLLANEGSRAQRPDPPEASVVSSMRRELVILLASMLLHRVSKGIA